MTTKYRPVNTTIYTSPGNVFPTASASNNPLTDNVALAFAESDVLDNAVTYTTATTYDANGVIVTGTFSPRRLTIKPVILTSFGLQNEVTGTKIDSIGGAGGVHLSPGIWLVNIRTRFENNDDTTFGPNDLIMWLGEFQTDVESPFLWQVWSNSVSITDNELVEVNVNIIVPVIGQFAPLSLQDFYVYISGANVADIIFSKNSVGASAALSLKKMNTPLL